MKENKKLKKIKNKKFKNKKQINKIEITKERQKSNKWKIKSEISQKNEIMIEANK